MKAIVCKEFGPPEKLVYEDLPLRAVGPGEVRIKVAAAGVNFPDVLMIQNKYQFRGTPPFAPGGEVCGEIVEVGPKVTQWKVGDRVAALTMSGGFAEECVAPAAVCVTVPASMSASIAAGFHLVYGTVIHALKDRGQLQPGETLLVLGASGGVGLAAVQLGKLMGAHVIAAASSADKLALCKSQGADEVVDYVNGSLKDEVRKLTRGKGADVIFDPVGGQFAQDSFSCINWKGRHLVVGFASGPIPEIALNRLLLKGAASLGVFWGDFIRREPAAQAANVQQLYQWFEEGRLKPLVSREYPLSQGAQALRDMADRKVLGKVVLVV
ncbi:MAG: NADPH:quinone oxidoreductase family protein [Panacagrimonas sp.]